MEKKNHKAFIRGVIMAVGYDGDYKHYIEQEIFDTKSYLIYFGKESLTFKKKQTKVRVYFKDILKTTVTDTNYLHIKTAKFSFLFNIY